MTEYNPTQLVFLRAVLEFRLGMLFVCSVLGKKVAGVLRMAWAEKKLTEHAGLVELTSTRLSSRADCSVCLTFRRLVLPCRPISSTKPRSLVLGLFSAKSCFRVVALPTSRSVMFTKKGVRTRDCSFHPPCLVPALKKTRCDNGLLGSL